MKTSDFSQVQVAGPKAFPLPSLAGKSMRWPKRATCAGRWVILLLFCLSWPARGDYQAFLHLPNIPGEATETNHQDWIEICSFNEGQIRALLATNTLVSDLVLTKSVDKATPRLVLSCLRGDRLPMAELQLLTAGSSNAVFYDLQFTNVALTADSQMLAAGSVATETIALRFDYVTWTYTILTATGAPPQVVQAPGMVQAYWNLLLNTGGSYVRPAAFDDGLRAFDGTAIIRLGTEGNPPTSALRINKNGTNYGVILVSTNDPFASKFRMQTSSGTRALMKLP